MGRLLLAAIAAVLLLAPAATAASRVSLSGPETALLQQMNRVRAAHGLGTLRSDGRLEQAAGFHGREMMTTQVFAHGAFASRMARFDVTGSPGAPGPAAPPPASSRPGWRAPSTAPTCCARSSRVSGCRCWSGRSPATATRGSSPSTSRVSARRS